MHDWIAGTAGLETLCRHAAAEPAIALDTEFMRVRTYWPELALVQLATRTEIALVDPLPIVAGRETGLAPLAALLSQSPAVKVMHSASEDLVAFARIGGYPVAPLFDTQIAAAFAGVGAGMGYQRLVAALIGVELEKGETRSDWLKRPLTESQRHYAELDVAHLLEIHAQLTAKLEARGMLAWCAEDCARLANSAAGGLPGDAHHELKSAWRWPIERQARLKRLLDWREATARTVDRPRLWVFDNVAAAELVENPPPDAAAVRARLAGQRGFPKTAAQGLHEALNDPLDDSALALRPIPAPLRGDDERRYDALRDAVARCAAALDLPPAVLAPRRLIEAVVRGEPPQELAGWRGEVLKDLIATVA